MAGKKNKEFRLPFGLFTALSILIIAAVVLVIYLNQDREVNPSDGIKPDNVVDDIKDADSEIKNDPNAKGEPEQEEESGEELPPENNQEDEPENGEVDGETVKLPLEIETVPEGYTVYLGLDVSEEALESENPFADPYVEKQIAAYFASFDGVTGAKDANLVVVYSGEKLSVLWAHIQAAVADTPMETYCFSEGDCIRISAAGFDGQVANVLATEGVACIYRENRTDATECLVLSVKPVRREAYDESEN